MTRFLLCCRRNPVTGGHVTATSSSIIYGIDRSAGEYTNIPTAARRHSTEEQTSMTDIAAIKLCEFNPKHLAEHLTSYDVTMLRAIRISELQFGKWMKKDKETLSPNVIAMIEHFNTLAYMICTEIVTEYDANKRALIITHYIKLMGCLNKLRNYNSMTAIKAALTHTAVYRLSDTWKIVAKRKRKKFEKFSNILCLITNADKILTGMMDLCDRSIPCVPYLGWLLHSINQWQTYEKFLKRSSTMSTSEEENKDEEGKRVSRNSAELPIEEQLTNMIKPSTEDILVAIKVAGEEASGVPVHSRYHCHSVEENVSILALFRGFQRNTHLYGNKLIRHPSIELTLLTLSHLDTEQLMAESFKCQP